MPLATEIKLKGINPNQWVVNNFRAFQNIAPLALLPDTTRYYYFNETMYNEHIVYLYLSGTVSHNITVDLFRSADIFGFDDTRAVPIPGATLVLTPGTPTAIDFNISNFGATALWMRLTTPAGLVGSIDEIALIIKP